MTLGIGTFLVGLALLIVVAVLVALPLLDRKTPVVEPLSPRDELEAERRTVVTAIRDLDFEHQMRKLNEEDYQALRLAQVQRGADILRRLETMDQRLADTGDRPSTAREAEIDDEIEAAVAALKSLAPAAASGAASGARAVVPCPACGNLARTGDRFCAKCGQPLIH